MCIERFWCFLRDFLGDINCFVEFHKTCDIEVLTENLWYSVFSRETFFFMSIQFGSNRKMENDRLFFDMIKKWLTLMQSKNYASFRNLFTYQFRKNVMKTFFSSSKKDILDKEFIKYFCSLLLLDEITKKCLCIF